MDNGELVVHVVGNAVSRASAVSTADAILSAAGRQDLRDRLHAATVAQVKYSFRQLRGWRDRVVPALDEARVSYLDINEGKNRIDVGVTSNDVRVGLQKAITRLGIPSEAVNMKIVGVPQLQYQWGGMGVEMYVTGLPADTCTITEVIRRRDMAGSLYPEKYGLTNSHCDGVPGQSGGFVEDGEWIADNIWDHPPISDAQCESFLGTTEPVCRYADVALYEYRSTYSDDNLRWYYTETYGDYGPEGPYDWINGEAHFFQGDSVHMHGYKTGHTEGTVQATCFDTYWTDTNDALLCQYSADYWSQGGDSGAPVWTETWFLGGSPPDTVERYIAGIHWGRNNNLAYFSGIHHVAEEALPEEPGWGQLCYSLQSMYCWY